MSHLAGALMLQFLWYRATCNFNTCISKWVSTNVKPCNRPQSWSPHLQIQNNEDSEVLTTHLPILHCEKHKCYTYKYNKFLKTNFCSNNCSPINHSFVLHKSEDPWLVIPRLWQWSYTSYFNKTKSSF